MKVWFASLAMSVALAAPAVAAPQGMSAEDARAAELACQLGGVCGDLAISEAQRDKEAIDGVSTRGLPSMGDLLAARSVSSTPRKTPGAPAIKSPRTPGSRVQLTRSSKGELAQPAGRRDLGGLAPDVPEALAGRAPLFVTFGLHSARLTPESASEVRAFAKAMRLVDAGEAGKRYRIEGHTDSSGGEAFNQSLSEQRAAAVREAIIAEGVEGNRIEAVGFGSDQPIDGYAKNNPLNRRVEASEIR